MLALRGATTSTPSGGPPPAPSPIHRYCFAAHTGILVPLPHTDTLVSGVTGRHHFWQRYKQLGGGGWSRFVPSPTPPGCFYLFALLVVACCFVVCCYRASARNKLLSERPMAAASPRSSAAKKKRGSGLCSIGSGHPSGHFGRWCGLHGHQTKRPF